MGVEYTYAHAAALLAMLPQTSRVYVAENPDNAYGAETMLLWRMEYFMRVLVWQRTEDGRTGANHPEPLPLFSSARGHDLLQNKGFVDSILNSGRVNADGN